MKLLLGAILAFSFMSEISRADEIVCGIKRMHCEACVESVVGNICKGDMYTTCEVKIVNSEKELGQVHLITKDGAAKIDEKTLGEAVKDSGYELEKCSSGGGDKKTKPSKS